MKHLHILLLAIWAFVACSEGDVDNGGNNGGGQTPPKQPEITLSTTATDFSTDGGSNVITFTSSEAWTVEVVNSRADDWCSIEPTSGPAGSAKITVTTTENNTPDDRTASIIIKAGTASKTINVSQKQKDALTVTSSKFEVSAEGGEITIEVKANINFDFEIDDAAEDWITHRSTRALKTSQLVFEIDENEATENRKANISISSGNLRETVTIYQEGNEPTIVLSDDEFTVSSSKETIAIDVKSNVDVAVEIPNNVNWIKENTSRAFSTNTYYFDIAQNDGYDNRTAEIKFTNKENGIYEKVKITQMQRDAIVIADSEYTFDENGGELDFEIKTNVEFKVSISSDAQSWIKQVDTRGLQSKTLHFDIAANNTDNDREGTITLSGGDAKQIIKVKQVVTPCQIIYTSTDGKIITPNVEAFGNAKIVSNVYENGQGVITFDRTITSVPNDAFKSQTKLVTISLPESVTSIGNYAFFNCALLSSINLPKYLSDIGHYVFRGCSSLAGITIPDGVTQIGYYVFRECKSLTSIDIPDSVTQIGGYAFSFCSNLSSINIPDGVTQIGIGAFYDCSSLSSIDIPDGVTQIGHAAFGGCSSLTSITIPDGVTQIGDALFANCSSLSSINIPDGVTRIGSNAFYRCSNLTSITIPDSVTEIGPAAFEHCSNLTSITIPDGVTQIGDSTFANCSNLSSITIPESVTQIGNIAFWGCSRLTSITIPDGVTQIGSYTFYNCRSLPSITIPDGVTQIGNWVFRGCESLTSITIPDGVTEIGEDAFCGCSSLTSINIPDGVTQIGDNAFWGCSSLTSITFPKSVEGIGRDAFYKVKVVYCMATQPPLLGEPEDSSSYTEYIYVPTNSVDTYKTSDGWKEYADKIVGYDF